jgi:hypothetical protein
MQGSSALVLHQMKRHARGGLGTDSRQNPQRLNERI